MQTAPGSWVSFSNSISPGPAKIFPFPFELRPLCSSLPGKHLHAADCGGDRPSSSPNPAASAGAAEATRRPRAAPGLGKMTSASARATQLVFEVPVPPSPSPPPALHNVKLSWLRHIHFFSPDLICLLLRISHSVSLWVLLASFEAVSSFAGHKLVGLSSPQVTFWVCHPTSPCDTLAPSPLHPPHQPTSTHSPWHTPLSTMSLREPFPILTFRGMDTSCPSSSLKPLAMSTPLLCPSFSPLTGQTDLEQMMVFPTLNRCLVMP